MPDMEGARRAGQHVPAKSSVTLSYLVVLMHQQFPSRRFCEIFKASPMLRPRVAQAQATSSLATITETQPIVIEDDEVPRTGASASSLTATGSTPVGLTAKKSSMLKAPPITRPKVLLKRPPATVTKVPPPVEKYSVPRGPVAPQFNISDFPMVLPELASSLPPSPATTLAPENATCAPIDGHCEAHAKRATSHRIS